MKKISQAEIKRIKDKYEWYSTLYILVVVFGISSLLIFGIFRMSNNTFIPAVILSSIFFILFLVCLFYSTKTVLDKEEKQKLKMLTDYEEAKVHKEALETYNKLNKIFS